MKSAKNLLIPFIVMILLAIGVVVFYFVDRGMKDHPASTTYNNVDLLYISPMDVFSVKVLQKSGNEVRVDRTQSADGTVLYDYKGSDKGLETYSQSEMSAYVTSLNSFVGCALVSENANLADYGLDSPEFTVTITKMDGTQKVILIGNLVADGSGCYVCAQGSMAVYIAGYDKYYCASKNGNDFIDDMLIEVGLKDLETVSFRRKKDSIVLSGNCSYDDSNGSFSILFNKPFTIDASAYFNKLIENLCSLSAVGYENATNENLSKFGLAIPEISITLGAKGGKTYNLAFSSARGGFYYGRLNGTGKIFKVEAERFELLETPLLKLISDYIFHDSCDKVDSVEVTGKDRQFVLKLDVAKDAVISDSKSTVSLDGRNAKVTSDSGRSYAAMLYESIFGISIGGVEENAVIPENAAADTSIKVYDRNHSAVVYAFYRRNDDSFYVTKDGKYTGFYVFKRELYNDGGQDTYVYGIWPAYEILTKAISNAMNGVYEIPDGK